MIRNLRRNCWKLLVTEASQFSEYHDILDKQPLFNYELSELAPIVKLIELHDIPVRASEIENYDWWFSVDISNSKASGSYLNLEYLATISEVWLDGIKVLENSNMFTCHRIKLEGQSLLTICIRGLSPFLNAKYSRPKWKTKLVKEQSLRWIRTSLFGRVSSWMPEQKRMGILGDVSIVEESELIDFHIQTSINSKKGLIRFNGAYYAADDIKKAELFVGEHRFSCQVTNEGGVKSLELDAIIDDVIKWWPHTHGDPFLYSVKLVISTNTSKLTHVLPSVGFRTLLVDQTGDNFSVLINDELIYCRGVCWTTCDTMLGSYNEESLLKQLELLKESGANMVRVIATTEYQPCKFYQLCDELGIMVWQDFMFANMDYPIGDEEFLASVTKESEQQLRRLAKHPSIVIYCGNSEVEQQARMLGFDQSFVSNRWFELLLPELIEKMALNVHYITSTPNGGKMPFYLSKGVSHYYGIGAYCRPLSEVRSHNVKFASETLGFSHIPSSQVLKAIFKEDNPAINDPRWKLGTPRDKGAGWDFDDIRDFYFKEIYKIDPAELRYTDHERYLQLSELVTGEILSQVFNEWRSSSSENRGGLVWFYQDLLLGAGWGLLDALGFPKAAYYYLKRIWQPICVCVTDEKFEGIKAHFINETSSKVRCQATVKLLDMNDQYIDHKSTDITLLPNSTISLQLDDMLDRFYDLSYSYRFGPRNIKSILVKLEEKNKVLSQTLFIPESIPTNKVSANLEVSAKQIDESNLLMTLTSDKFLHGIKIEIDGYNPDDNYFSLFPGEVKIVQLAKFKSIKRFKGFVSSPNLSDIVRIKVVS